MRLLILLLSAATVMSAQAFTDLATTTDGSILYFASPLSQHGADQVPQVGKIFGASGSVISLVVQPQCAFTPQIGVGTCGMQAPDVSGDGSLLAYTFSEFNPNLGINLVKGTLALEFFERQINGSLRISRNGKFVLSFDDPNSITPQFLDISTNTTTALTGFSVIGDGRQSIADDGSVILLDPSGHPVLWKVASTTPLALTHKAGNARIDRDAKTVVYEWVDTQYHLNAYDVASGADTALWSEGSVPPIFGGLPPALYYQPSLSDDGRHVLAQVTYTSNTKDLWIMTTDGSSARQLTSGAGVASDVLSGNGVIAYASTNDNRILRVDTQTVDRTGIVGRAPILASVNGITVAPGDYTAVGGGGLENISVLVNGEPTWVIAAHNGIAAFRIPWDAPVGQTVPITVSNGSQFDSGAVMATVQASVPHSWISQPVHQDFSDFVKPDSPAKPGEIVHLYLTGLGVITPLIPLDQPAPPFTQVVTPLVCTMNPGGPAKVFYAGEAPGQTWIYQVDVQIPSGAATGTLDCGAAATFQLAVSN